LAIRFREPERPVVERLDDGLPFMHEPVVEAAEGDEIGELGLPACRPVLHVMAVHVAFEAAAGEAAALVSGAQGAADAGRDGPGLSPDIQRLALRTLDDPDHAAVAGETAGGLGSDRRSLLQLAAARM